MYGKQNAENRPGGKLLRAAAITLGRRPGSYFLTHPKCVWSVFPRWARLQIESVKRRMEECLSRHGLPGKQRTAEPSEHTEDQAFFDGGDMHVHDTLVMFQFLPPLDCFNLLFFQPKGQILQLIEDSEQVFARRSSICALELGAQFLRLLPENSIWTDQIAV